MARDEKRPTRWTQDTETAFLLALRLEGNVAAACRAIGRSAHGAQDRRARMPAFAARWQEALDAALAERAMQDEARRRASGEIAPADPGDDDRDGGDDAPAERIRHDGWTPLRQRAFLRALGETGRYGAAAAAIRMSTTAVRARRRRDPAFAAACDRAIARADATLEQVAYERATKGWDEPIVQGGRIVGHRRRFSDTLLRQMLLREDKAAAARAAASAAAPKPRMTSDEVDAALTRKLDALARRHEKEERARMIAWADDMVRRGLAP